MKEEYTYNEIIYDNNNDDNQKEDISDEELLNILNDEIDKVDHFVDILWNEVILRYIESNKTVLSKLTTLDKHKLKKFIIENSKIYKSLSSETKILRDNIESQ
jgi:hypothetical protein